MASKALDRAKFAGIIFTGLLGASHYIACNERDKFKAKSENCQKVVDSITFKKVHK